MRKLAAATLLAVFFMGWFCTPVCAEELKWKDELFTRDIHGEDIKTTLRSIAKANNTEIIFKGNIKGEVNKKFENMTLEGTFKMLLDEYGLDYSYSPQSKYMTVTLKTEKQSIVFYRMKYENPQNVKTVLQKFKAWAQGFEIHMETNSLFLKGSQSEIDSALLIVKELDKATEEELKNKLLKKSIEMLTSEVKYEVIPLLYASVGPTTYRYANETVSVPGVDETIKEILGYSKDKEKAQTLQSMQQGLLPQTLIGIDKTSQTSSDDSLKSSYSINSGLDKPPLISIDKRTNSVVVRGRDDQIAKVKELLKQLDKPIPMVELEIMILSAKEDFSRSLGMSWEHLLGGGNNIATRAGTLSSDTSVATGSSSSKTSSSGSTTVDSIAPAISFIYSDAKTTISSLISAVESKDLGKVLAAPRLITLDNREATIKIGLDHNVKVYTQNTSSVTTIPTGISFRVTPHVINPADNVTHKQVLLNIFAEKSGAASTAVDGISDTDKSEINTQIIVPQDSTVVIGGLFKTEEGYNDEGVPILKDIPIIGALFKKDSKSNNKTETVFFITPRIIDVVGLDAVRILEKSAKDRDEKALHKVIDEKYNAPKTETKKEKDSGKTFEIVTDNLPFDGSVLDR
ncbi:type II secretion system protein GspD [Candidatus Magnetomonas plexicatena]|uniref:type II secretion system protein GspD n=1 Tax=Candidatus Magnetomonas plexicatena TaxID=2552947 RepID=UPI001C7915F4|nr:type II secretion system protein GspD [Nitrospirales bacterium LBB_01]